MFRIFRIFRKKDNTSASPGSMGKQHGVDPSRLENDPYEPYITDDRGIIVTRSNQSFEEALAFRERRRARKTLK